MTNRANPKKPLSSYILSVSDGCSTHSIAANPGHLPSTHSTRTYSHIVRRLAKGGSLWHKGRCCHVDTNKMNVSSSFMTQVKSDVAGLPRQWGPMQLHWWHWTRISPALQPEPNPQQCPEGQEKQWALLVLFLAFLIAFPAFQIYVT